MKSNYILQSLVMFFFVFSATAQQGINYKALINNVNGNVLANTAVTIQFTILENGTTNVFSEYHNPTTDDNGIIIINIGEGILVSGDFNTIDWGSNPHFLKTEIDSGDGLTNMGTTEFKSVPYAILAKAANMALLDEVDDADADPTNEIQIISKEGNFISLSGDGGTIELPEIGESNFYYADKDSDGFGEYSDLVYTLSPPVGYIIVGGDCNDSNPTIFPGATEIPNDGIDQDCNGSDLVIDNDNDGFNSNDDCNDNDSNIFPGAIEIFGDEIDNDCDGNIDELYPNVGSGGNCLSGWSDCDGIVENGCETNVSSNVNSCGECNQSCPPCTECVAGNCRPIIDCDRDGFRSGPGGDCNDNDHTIFPGRTELCDGIDNDCDGEIDELCIEYYSYNEILGGRVFYILQSGDDGYVEGETHGFVLAQERNFNVNRDEYVYEYPRLELENWQEAMTYCENLSLNGRSDWLLPSRVHFEMMEEDLFNPENWPDNEDLYYDDFLEEEDYFSFIEVLVPFVEPPLPYTYWTASEDYSEIDQAFTWQFNWTFSPDGFENNLSEFPKSISNNKDSVFYVLAIREF